MINERCARPRGTRRPAVATAKTIMVRALFFSLFSLSQTIRASANELKLVRHVPIPGTKVSPCNSDRPNSFATHRTLAIPESCVTGSSMEHAMADALCCVYTHVVVSASEAGGPADRPRLEAYDGSTEVYGDCVVEDGDNGTATAYTSVEVMENVMRDICSMSMGSVDCSNQATCIEGTNTNVTLGLSPSRPQQVLPQPPPADAPSSDEANSAALRALNLNYSYKLSPWLVTVLPLLFAS